MEATERLLEQAAQLGAIRALETLGLTAGELTQNKARKVYGKWFDDAVKRGRIRPVRIDDSKRDNGRKRFRVVDIQTAYAADTVRAELKF